MPMVDEKFKETYLKIITECACEGNDESVVETETIEEAKLDAETAKKISDRYHQGESMSNLRDEFPVLEKIWGDKVIDMRDKGYHEDDDFEKIEQAVMDYVDELADGVKEEAKSDSFSAPDLNQYFKIRGKSFTTKQRKGENQWFDVFLGGNQICSVWFVPGRKDEKNDDRWEVESSKTGMTWQTWIDDYESKAAAFASVVQIVLDNDGFRHQELKSTTKLMEGEATGDGVDPEVWKIAKELHDTFCHRDTNDGSCTWVWHSETRKGEKDEYVERAKLLQKVAAKKNTANDLITLLRELGVEGFSRYPVRKPTRRRR